MKKFGILFALLTLISLGLTGPAAAVDFDMEKATQLFEVKCAKCHSTERPKGKNKTMEDWTTTVKRMQSKSPGWFTDEEAQTLIEYLSTAHGR